MAQRVRRTRKQWRVGARVGRYSATASNVSDTWYRDGEDATALASINAGQTNSLLLGAYGDFVSALASNWQKAKPKIKTIIFSGQFGPNDTADASADEYTRISWHCWLIACPQAVATEWVLNSLDPNDVTLSGSASAAPHSLFKRWFVTTQTGADPQMLAWGGKFKQTISLPRPYRLTHPYGLYFMFKPIYEGGNTPGNSEYSLTWNVGIKAQPAIGV